MPRKAIFDAIREARGKGFDTMEVGAIDNLLDALGVPREASVAPAGLKTSAKGIELIHSFEGCEKKRPDGKIEAYPDPGSGGEPWTIGWGSTGDDPFNGGRIRKGTVWTQAQCDERFVKHLAQFEKAVRDAVGSAKTTQAQFDALVSFTYNLGAGNLNSSTLLKKHKAGDYAGAANEFGRWNKASGKVMAGLTRRRAAEATLYKG